MEIAEYQRMFDLEDHHWWFQARYDLIRRIIDRHAPADADSSCRLLDIGCGTGMFLRRQSENRIALGLDFSSEALKFTRGRGLEGLVCGDSQELPFAENSFEVVTAFDLIEHVDRDSSLVKEVNRVLKPGGKFIATVPAHPALWSEHDVALHHKRRYVKSDFSALFDPSIWRQRRLTWSFTGIYPLAATIRLSRKLIPPRDEAFADTRMTPSLLNGLLFFLHRFENAWAERFDLPFGLSLLTVQEKK